MHGQMYQTVRMAIKPFNCFVLNWLSWAGGVGIVRNVSGRSWFPASCVTAHKIYLQAFEVPSNLVRTLSRQTSLITHVVVHLPGAQEIAAFALWCVAPCANSYKTSADTYTVAVICTIWGIIATCTGLVQTYGQLLALRVLLGVFEAGLLYVHSSVSQPHELTNASSPGMAVYLTFCPSTV